MPDCVGLFQGLRVVAIWAQDKFVVWFYRTAIIPVRRSDETNIALQLWPLAQQKSNYALQLWPLAQQKSKSALQLWPFLQLHRANDAISISPAECRDNLL